MAGHSPRIGRWRPVTARSRTSRSAFRRRRSVTAKPALRQAAKLRFGGRLRRLPCGARSRGPVAQLAARTGVRYAQTVATSQSTKRAARAGHELCAPRRLTGASRPAATPASRQRLACSTKRHRRCLASGGTRQGRFVRRRGTQHRGRRAYSHASSSDLPRLFERSAQRVASYAARPRGEYRSAVGPKGRPPHHEPLPGAARRAARTFEGDSGLSWIAAMRRDPALDVGASNAGSHQNENG